MSVGTLIEAVGIALSWPTIGWIIVGVIFGIIVGALPGIGPVIGMSIAIPLTVLLSPVNAIILLVSIYSGAMYGGVISAILINTPGTSAAAASTLDGYPLAKKGQAMKALSVSVTSSVLAGVLSVGILFILSPVIAEIVLYFQSPEYFLMAVLGISLITIVSKGSIVKGLVAGAFGFLITTIGIAPTTPNVRYTFGYLGLFDGLSFVAALVGIFAIGEMIKLAAKPGGISEATVEITGNVTSGIVSVIKRPATLVKSSLIGLGIGSIPGAGATISTFVSYSEAMRSSTDPESFGKGNISGLISAESANNATVGGSLIPTLSFGIPGSGSTAILLGGLLMHGIRPGPDLFGSELYITYSMFVALLIGNLVILIVGLTLVTRASYLTKIDTNYLIPIVTVLAVIGVFVIRSNYLDVFSLVIFGIIGYLMFQHNYSPIAFVLGVVLGPIAEENLGRSLQLSGGSFDIFLTKPLSAFLLAIIMFILLSPVIKSIYGTES